MGFLTAIIDALAEFVRRNPIFTLIVVVLALTAPALLKGIALFVLYLVLGFLVLVFLVSLLFRWRIRRVQRQMEEQFGAGGFGAGYGSGRGARTEGSSRQQEGEVKVYRTSETPEKRVSENVGDYVEFEETKGPRA